MRLVLGGLLATAPFHWSGDLADMGVIMIGGFVERMGAVPVSNADVDAIGAWLDAQPTHRPSIADPSAVERGRSLFNSSAVGCADCHAGSTLTNDETIDVGTGGAFQVPSLRGVWLRDPFFHRGCAPTLEAVIDGGCGTLDRHGRFTRAIPWARAILSLMRWLLALVLAGCAGPSMADGGDADRGSDAGPGPSGPWRSALYPDDWTPESADAEGRFLHDFSYAGYSNGEREPGSTRPIREFSVDAMGADASGAADSTVAIQAAIDAASADGGVVRFGPGLYRVEGMLRVQASNVVLVGEGAQESRLYFSQLDGMTFRSHLTFAGTLESVAEVALATDGAARADEVEVVDPGALRVGDDVDLGWVITDAFVEEHAMTDVWRVFNGEWQPFFRRRVVAIEGSRVRLDVPLRYPAQVRDGASLRVIRGWIREVGVESLGLANAADPDAAWAVSQVHVLEMNGVADGWIRGVASFPSPGAPTEGEGAGAHLASGGLLIAASKRITIDASEMGAAQNRGPGGNGYLFEVRASNEILLRDSVGDGGRHNFTTNWGFGTSGCVWLRVRSAGGSTLPSRESSLRLAGLSDFHHSLATANLVDQAELMDGWSAVNRLQFSSGAGHAATQNVFWNTRGTGSLRSFQYGWGYIVGTAPELSVRTSGSPLEEIGTEPDDFVEGLGRGEELIPPSLYDDQLRRRLGR